MTSAVLKLFVTGDPGCGKTTAIRRVVERLRGSVSMTGFWTEEFREGTRRVGFRGVTIDGRSFPLADVRTAGPYRVGPYGVDLDGLATVGVAALTPSTGTELVVLDEVGKMESFSQPFRLAVEALLAGSTPVLATVALHGLGFPKRVRQDPRIELLSLSRAHRDAAVDEIVRRLARAGVGRSPAASQRKGVRR